MPELPHKTADIFGFHHPPYNAYHGIEPVPACVCVALFYSTDVGERASSRERYAAPNKTQTGD